VRKLLMLILKVIPAPITSRRTISAACRRLSDDGDQRRRKSSQLERAIQAEKRTSWTYSRFGCQ